MDSSDQAFTLQGNFHDYRVDTATLSPGVHADIGSVLRLMSGQCHSFSRSMTDRERTIMDLEDLHQEIWVTLLKKAHYYSPEISKLTTWSARLMPQHIGSLKRALNKARADLDPRAAGGTAEDPADVRVERQEESEEASRLAKVAIQALRSPVEIVIVFKFYGLNGCGQMTTQEIATHMGVSDANVTRIRLDAEARMRRHMEDRTPDED